MSELFGLVLSMVVGIVLGAIAGVHFSARIKADEAQISKSVEQVKL